MRSNDYDDAEWKKLDHLLAHDFIEDKEISRLKRLIDNFSRLEVIQGTSIMTEIIPAIRELKSWLDLFEGNMMHPHFRLRGATNARICYAERGMSLVLRIISLIDGQIMALKMEFPDRSRLRPAHVHGVAGAFGGEEQIQGYEEKRKKANDIQRTLMDFGKQLLGCDQGMEQFEMGMMKNWLNRLFYETAAYTTSSRSVLTRTNIGELDKFCSNYYK